MLVTVSADGQPTARKSRTPIATVMMPVMIPRNLFGVRWEATHPSANAASHEAHRNAISHGRRSDEVIEKSKNQYNQANAIRPKAILGRCFKALMFLAKQWY